MKKLVLVALLFVSGLAFSFPVLVVHSERSPYAEGNFSYNFKQKEGDWKDRLKGGISIGYSLNRYFAAEIGVQNIQKDHPEYADLVGRVQVPLFGHFEAFAKGGIAARISERVIGTQWNPVATAGVKYNLEDGVYAGVQITHLFKEHAELRDNNQVMLVVGRNFSV